MSTPNLSLPKNASVTNKAFLLSFIPILGGLSIVKESHRLGDRTATQLSWATFALAIVTALAGHLLTAWLLQICLVIWLKAKHSAKRSAKRSQAPTTHPLVQVDFNTCSKNDLVHVLDLPIVYANDIDLIRSEGYLFTHLEELTNIAGIPNEHVRRIAPQLIFSYHTQIDNNHTWRQLNNLTASEMETRGIASGVAQKIIEERTQKGDYHSAVDVKRRTGLTFRSYENLV